ncbi:ABC transporter permease [Plantactinospora sp. GCM10030261]|uniref:ABC transporter permease n=1 Tax=Plantactinospora sp. GCM10030261 TaxID=3273420 RepID=UPI003615AB4C
MSVTSTTGSPTNASADPAQRRLKLDRLRDFGIPIAVLLIFVYLSIASPVFLTPRNMLNLLDQSAIVGMIAAAGTLVLIAGGLDLSTGAIFAISGVIAAQAAPSIGTAGAVAVGATVGIVFGLINGLISTVGRVNAIITTLATGIMIRGLALVITGGALVRVTDPGFSQLGRGDLFGVKYVVFVFIGIVAACWFLLSRTAFGRYVYATGGNPEAANLSGVRVNRIRTIAFMISGLAAACAGVLVASRVSTGQADAGLGMEINAIAAIVIGGTSINGGEGAVWRTVFGVLLVTLVGNGFNLLNVNPIWQQVFQGAVILAAVALDSWSKREST